MTISWPSAFFILSLITALFGFNATMEAGDVSKLMFGVFLALFVLTYFFRTARDQDREQEGELASH